MTACLYFYKLKFDIFEAMVFNAWLEQAVNSIDFSHAAARRGAPWINVLAGLDTPVCAPFQRTPSLHNTENVSLKKRTASLRGSSTRKYPIIGKSEHIREIVSLAPSRQEGVVNALNHLELGISFYFPGVYTPRQISSQSLVVQFLHFLHAPIQNSQDLQKSTSSCDT